MRILIICSKAFYSKIPPVQKALESRNIDVVLPNCYDAPETEQTMWDKGPEEHRDFKARMYKKSCDVISGVDAVLVLNYDKEKDGRIFPDYIGGATFLEMYDAFRMQKKIYLLNGIPEGLLYDEIHGFSPVILHGDLSLIEQ